MRIFGWEIKRSKRSSKNYINPVITTSTSILQSREYPMLLSAVYRCVDLIGNDIAQLPFFTYRIKAGGYKELYFDHPVFRILNEEPNEDMTRFTFIKTLISSTLLTGNGYAYIKREGTKVTELIYLPSDHVTVVNVDHKGKEHRRYRVQGFEALVEPKDMIHILNFSYNGITGVSTLTHARQTLRIATDSEQHASKFFEGGAAVNGVLTIDSGRLNKEQKDQNYNEWEARMNPRTGHGGLVILEGNMKYQPISINPKDAQMLETREFNVIDICRFFSVSPVKAFDLSKSSYSTLEATQLAHLTDTISPWLTKIELEFKRKLFYDSEKNYIDVKFNTKAMLRADSKSQAEFFAKLFQVGAMTPNEIRRDLDMNQIENGDNSFVQVNVQTLDQAVNKHLYDNNLVSNKEEDNG